MKSVLLTGASGFLGCHLTQLLLAHRYDVYLFVRKKSVAIDDFERRGAKVIVRNFESEASLKSAFESKQSVRQAAGYSTIFFIKIIISLFDHFRIRLLFRMTPYPTRALLTN